MKTTDTLPSSWGTTRIADLDHPGESEALELPGWRCLTLPPADGEQHHGTRGSIAPDTLVLALDGVVIALADAVSLHLDNLYAHDSEYLFVVRLREVLDEEAWAGLPWAPFRAPTVVYAIDKFHHTHWARLPEDERDLSYGGGWDDLQACADRERLPTSRDAPWRDETAAPSDGAMLRAVREGDVAGLREMIARGGSLLAGAVAPDVRNGLSMGMSVACHHSLLVTAAMVGPVEVIELLLDAGASLYRRDQEDGVALRYAIANARDEHVDALLHHGVDPRVVAHDQDAIGLARQRAPHLVERLVAAAERLARRDPASTDASTSPARVRYG